MNKFFSGKSQELRKGLFFEIAVEIKPTTPITTSTRAMKMRNSMTTGKMFVDRKCWQTESASLGGLGFPD